MTEDHGFYSIIDYSVDSPATQQALAEAFADIQRRWVRFHPGYRGAQLFGDLDGTRLYHLIRWTDEAAFREFERRSDTEGRVAAIQAALRTLAPGQATPRMSGAPLIRVLREVLPGPRDADAET